MKNKNHKSMNHSNVLRGTIGFRSPFNFPGKYKGIKLYAVFFNGKFYTAFTKYEQAKDLVVDQSSNPFIHSSEIVEFEAT